MKRKPEKILIICGIGLFIIGAFFVFVFGNVITNTDFETFINESVEQESEQDIPVEEFEGFFEQVQSINYNLHGVLMVLIAAIGAVALFTKHSRLLSGIFSLIGAGMTVIIFWWMILPLVPAILYFIAGFMFLLRKPQSK
ncbi:hypothetical protein J2S78_000741 [Salibacterium salarium]|uniref:DUF4064 domain-containing protein n=1 Tax=Salibacterium salarium TaxID=284579 RepID=UPI00163A70A9|nr:DUF4064 domain-containing protein [Salibacterium salarium]MDQ0298333.1 hypothetical protein [Salibacterium salarium]